MRRWQIERNYHSWKEHEQTIIVTCASIVSRLFRLSPRLQSLSDGSITSPIRVFRGCGLNLAIDAAKNKTRQKLSFKSIQIKTIPIVVHRSFSLRLVIHPSMASMQARLLLVITSMSASVHYVRRCMSTIYNNRYALDEKHIYVTNFGNVQNLEKWPKYETLWHNHIRRGSRREFSSEGDCLRAVPQKGNNPTKYITTKAV